MAQKNRACLPTSSEIDMGLFSNHPDQAVNTFQALVTADIKRGSLNPLPFKALTEKVESDPRRWFETTGLDPVIGRIGIIRKTVDQAVSNPESLDLDVLLHAGELLGKTNFHYNDHGLSPTLHNKIEVNRIYYSRSAFQWNSYQTLSNITNEIGTRLKAGLELNDSQSQQVADLISYKYRGHLYNHHANEAYFITEQVTRDSQLLNTVLFSRLDLDEKQIRHFARAYRSLIAIIPGLRWTLPSTDQALLAPLTENVIDIGDCIGNYIEVMEWKGKTVMRLRNNQKVLPVAVTSLKQYKNGD